MLPLSTFVGAYNWNFNTRVDRNRVVLKPTVYCVFGLWELFVDLLWIMRNMCFEKFLWENRMFPICACDMSPVLHQT